MWLKRLTATLLAGTIFFTTQTSATSDDDLASTALSIAPEDVAFFSTSVNMGDAWDDLINGNFVKRVRAVPFIQEVEAEFARQWENPPDQLSQAKIVLMNPSVQNLLKLGQDMFTDEVFVYGGDDWCGMIEGMMSFQNEMVATLSRDPEAMAEFFLNLQPEDIAGLDLPTTIIGFRLANADNATIQLDALEGILRFGGGQIPEAQPFLEKLKRTDLQDGQSLAITLDASLIPLDQFSGDELQVAEKVVELLADRSFSFGLGVKDNMLLLAFSENADAINLVGEADEKLLNHEAMAVLQAAAPSNLRSISYVSEQWRESQWSASFDSYFSRISAQLAPLSTVATLDTEAVTKMREDIEADAAWLDSKLADYTPEFGPLLAWSNATDDGPGLESMSYDWSKGSAFENASPMTITQHAGSQPLAVVSFKQAQIPFVEEMIEYVLDKAPNHIRNIARLNSEAQSLDEADEQIDAVMGLVNEAYEIIRDKLVVSLDEHESLVAIAGDWVTTELTPQLPPAEVPLPLPELAGASKLSDRDLFISGCDELFQILDRVVDMIREQDPNAVPPDYTVPRPNEERMNGATKYSYPQISEQVPLEGFDLQLVVTDDAIVYGYSERQVQDMLEARALSTAPSWLEDNAPVAAVTYMDFAGMFASVRPWIEYGFSVSGMGLDTPLIDQPGPNLTGNDVLMLWDCLKSTGKTAGTVTIDDSLGATLTRTVWVGE